MDGGGASGRRYGGATADERRADRRERLIRAAIALYGEQGYRRTTVNAVCRAAGLTPRYFYESFDNSEALLLAAFSGVAEFVAAHVASAAGEEGAPDDRLRALLTAYYTLLREERTVARVFLSELSGIDERVDTLFARSVAGFAELIATTLDPARVSVPVASLAKVGAMHGLLAVAREWVTGGCADPVDEVVRTAAPLCRMLVDDR